MKNFDYMDDGLEASRGLVDEGVSLNFGPLSLCKIKRLIGDMYQVDSMHYKVTYSNMFTDFNIAFTKFSELKEALVKNGIRLKR